MIYDINSALYRSFLSTAGPGQQGGGGSVPLERMGDQLAKPSGFIASSLDRTWSGSAERLAGG
eukprot:8808650-Pyramimonas_sp.AAC.1